MKVLKSWSDVGNSINNLKMAGLPLHTDPVKCWDFNNIREIFLEKLQIRNSCIVDLGCGPSLYGCMTLEFLRCMGYKNLIGIDLHFPLYARLSAKMRGWFRHHSLSPYRMKTADITCTGLKKHTVDASILLSVVEHGVNLERLFFELNRIMKIGGILYLSTDYWEEKLREISTPVASGAYRNKKLPWSIFDRDSIKALISIAGKYGFYVCDGAEIPSCMDRPVFWNNAYYTIISIVFEKQSSF